MSNFEKVVLNYDKAQFEERMEEIRLYMQYANDSIAEFDHDYGVKLTDYQIDRMFIQFENNPGDFLSDAFTDYKLKSARDAAKNEALHFLARKINFLKTENIKDILPFVESRRGKLFLQKDAEQRLQDLCQRSIDTPEAALLKDLHEKATEAISNLLEEARKQNHRIGLFAFYEIGFFGEEVKPRDFDYSRV